MHDLIKMKIKYLVGAIVTLQIGMLVFYLMSNNIVRWGEKEAFSEDLPEAVKALPSKEVESSNKPKYRYLEGLTEIPSLDSSNITKEELSKYIKKSRTIEQRLQVRLEVLLQKESQLESLEESIAQKIKKLEEERKFLEQTLQKEAEIKKERLESLVALYSKMEPKKAAPIFAQMDRDLLVAIFGEMDQKQKTRIMEAVDPAQAVEITEYLAKIRSGNEYKLLQEVNRSLSEEFGECRGLPEAAVEEEESKI